MICDRLADIRTNDENKPANVKKQQVKADIERETDLTSDNDNERLIQRDFTYIDDDEEYEEIWNGENEVPHEVYDWSVNTSAREVSTRGNPLLFDQKHQTSYGSQSVMQKSASIGFSELERNGGVDPAFVYNSTFPQEAPFVRSKFTLYLF